jgi:hypothetical protein
MVHTTVPHYAFVDESGTVAPFSGSRHLVVALLAVAAPRPIELHVRRMQKRYGASLRSGEMKANASREQVVADLLHALAEEAAAIIAVIVDKSAIARPPADPEDIYRTAVGLAVAHAVNRWPRLDVYLDRRYTAERLRDRLEREIREVIAGLPQEVVMIRQEDSVAYKALQAADYVAWAIFQKYEHGERRFCDIFAEQMIVEEIVQRSLW